MSAAHVMRVALVFLILLVLHYTLRPALPWRASMDFVVIAILIVAVRTRPGVAALLGFFVGILIDVPDPSTMGSSALGLAFVAFGASYLKSSFFSDKPAMNALLFFVGKWVYDLVFIVSEGAISGNTVWQILWWSPIAALLTAIAGAMTLVLSSSLLRPSRR